MVFFRNGIFVEKLDGSRLWIGEDEYEMSTNIQNVLIDTTEILSKNWMI